MFQMGLPCYEICLEDPTPCDSGLLVTYNNLVMAVRGFSAEIQCGGTSLTIWQLLKWTDLAGPLTMEVEK